MSGPIQMRRASKQSFVSSHPTSLAYLALSSVFHVCPETGIHTTHATSATPATITIGAGRNLREARPSE